jgi:thiamine-monophosphate kinase
MNEFELIRKLTAGLATGPGVVVGVGDDCAVLESGSPEEWLLFKTDAVVEGVHFRETAAPRQIGHKALARCLSDIAAMGGKPTCALVTLALPAAFPEDRVIEIYAGLRSLADRHGVAIVGGETTANPGGLLLSIALLGTVPRGKALLRSGARPGDAIFVSGELGGSMDGRHLNFEPRLAEAQWLNANHRVHAMIDLSDGLAGDLRHVLAASGCGAELLGKMIPVSAAARRKTRTESSAKPPLLAALTDGEDFELLFTVAAVDAVAIKDGWARQFPEVRLTCIGRITREPGLKIRTEQGLRDMTEHGYVHFQKS